MNALELILSKSREGRSACEQMIADRFNMTRYSPDKTIREAEARKAGEAAEELARKDAARDLLKNHYLWYTDTTEEGEEIIRCSWCDLPKEDIEVEGHLDGCQIAAALKEQK